MCMLNIYYINEYLWRDLAIQVIKNVNEKGYSAFFTWYWLKHLGTFCK